MTPTYNISQQKIHMTNVKYCDTAYIRLSHLYHDKQLLAEKLHKLKSDTALEILKLHPHIRESLPNNQNRDLSMNSFLLKLALGTYIATNMAMSATSVLNGTEPKIASRNIHDTPEAKKSGQTWYHYDNSKYTKFTHLLSEKELDATISIYKDLSGQYFSELRFLACLSLTKNECDIEIKKHLNRFVGFDTEYQEEEDGLFSVFLVKTQEIEHYADFHEQATSLITQYGLTYLDLNAVPNTHTENVPPSNSEDENTFSSGRTTHSAHTTGEEHINITAPASKKRKNIAPGASKKRKREVKQVTGQSSLLTYFRKNQKN